MKHNWNFFQNESADEEKKALLPVLVIPLVRSEEHTSELQSLV